MCLQDNTPKPTKDVYLHTTPAATFFVSQFGGFAVDDITVSAKAAALVSKLKARGENFVESVFFSGAALLVIFHTLAENKQRQAPHGLDRMWC